MNFSKLGKFLLELDFHTLILNENFFVVEWNHLHKLFDLVTWKLSKLYMLDFFTFVNFPFKIPNRGENQMWRRYG